MTKTNAIFSSNKRLFSLDALCGFDTLMISGLIGLPGTFKKKTGSKILNNLVGQMRHIGWKGFTFYYFISLCSFLLTTYPSLFP